MKRTVNTKFILRFSSSVVCFYKLITQAKFSFLICVSVLLSTSVDTQYLWIHASHVLHPIQVLLTFHCSVPKKESKTGRIWLLQWFLKSLKICIILVANFYFIITWTFSNSIIHNSDSEFNSLSAFFPFSSFLIFFVLLPKQFLL